MYLICNHKNNLTYNEVRTLKENLKSLDKKNINSARPIKSRL